jgi:hypothetical protein
MANIFVHFEPIGKNVLGKRILPERVTSLIITADVLFTGKVDDEDMLPQGGLPSYLIPGALCSLSFYD